MRKIVLLILCFSACACKKEVTKIEPIAFKIPDNITAMADTNFGKRQGILYYAQIPFSGFVIESYSSKKLAFKNGYWNGKLEGIQEKWFSDGTKMEIRFYHANQKIGRHTGWWENKKIRFEYFIENDIPIKMHREWYPNGQLYSLSNYNVKGQPEGTQQMWFETGQIKANYVIKDGRRFGFLGAKGCMGEGEKKQTGLNFKKK